MSKFILNINSKEDKLSVLPTDVECYMLNSDMEYNSLQDIKKQLTSAEKIVLLYGNNAAEFCHKLNADGVVVDLCTSGNIKKDIKNIKDKIGNKILGVICRNRRHEAMIVSENEPDFVIFKMWNEGIEKTVELAEWYNEFFLLQMAVMPQDEDVSLDGCHADIIILTPKSYKIFVAKK